MKRISQILLITGLLLGCSKKDSNSIIRLGGIYTGCFEYRGTTYWCSISFEDYNYIEWPSGGIYYQKPLECLTVGTYTLDETTFTFNLDSFKYSDHPNPCESDMLLPGTYNINYFSAQDSILFEKGIGVNRIVYYLGK